MLLSMTSSKLPLAEAKNSVEIGRVGQTARGSTRIWATDMTLFSRESTLISYLRALLKI
jgi:hypothetical protein